MLALLMRCPLSEQDDVQMIYCAWPKQDADLIYVLAHCLNRMEST
jgi:hypothetical protein